MAPVVASRSASQRSEQVVARSCPPSMETKRMPRYFSTNSAPSPVKSLLITWTIESGANCPMFCTNADHAPTPYCNAL